jgi:hypothetical protein
MAASPDAGTIIDLARYPIDRPGHPAFDACLAAIRSELDDDGCAVLKGFVRTECLADLEAEAERTAPFAHRNYNRTNAYFGRDDESLPAHHPKRRFYERSNAFVPADNFGPASILRAIYEAPYFAPFIQAALQEEDFFRYDDPLADVIINVVEPGGGFPWHFDTNNYTVTLSIRNGDAGGLFRYCPNLRTPTDENYDGVRAVLDGDSTGVHTLSLEPGDLQIFKGRYALHNVSPVQGNRARYVGIFSFAEIPGMVGSVERTSQLYGRVLPIHREREGLRSDALVD